MSTILFRILPESGHLNATYALARALQERGHAVVYATLETHRTSVESQGFRFHPIAKDLLMTPTARFAASKEPNVFSGIGRFLKARKYRLSYRQEFMKGEAFDQVIAELEPDLLVIDSPFARHAVSIRKHRLPFVILESMSCLNRADNCPPLCSDFIPRDDRRSRARCSALWRWYFFRNWLASKVGFQIKPAKSYLMKLCRNVGFPISELNFDRYFHIGIDSVPELILSPKALDFPRLLQPNQTYIGPSCDLARKESTYDYRFDDEMEALIDWKAAAPDQRKLVYCSLGGMSFRYLGVSEFFSRLMEAFRNQPRWRLIISIGNELDDQAIRDAAPENVLIFRRVPQLRALDHVDAMVTHGGMNSLTECALKAVPMAVFPGSDKIDQTGNGARVAYHGIGVRGNLQKSSAAKIRSLIETLLNDPQFKSRIRAIRSQILDDARLERGVEIIEGLLNRHPRIDPVEKSEKEIVSTFP